MSSWGRACAFASCGGRSRPPSPGGASRTSPEPPATGVKRFVFSGASARARVDAVGVRGYFRRPVSKHSDAATGESQELTFEAALERLERLVGELEAGDLPLEAALAAFEEGVRLSRQCAAQLREAERRIEVLVREGDELVTRPYEAPEDAS
ncbi:MAG: exodeoxyribonuclease VII small subunit [Deltaproteobacteria bacterium]|nr:MAG: exodeoxyribonuclease VII small subunit [Deltaproteobacteria bacterium]